MINILIPIASKSKFFDDDEFFYPKPLIEIDGQPMIQHVLENFLKIDEPCKFIFIINQEDCVKFHLDESLRLLTNDNCEIIEVEKNTKGAACSCLLAIEHIRNDDELIISNGDQIIETDFNEVLKKFRNSQSNGGVITFDSVHPKWSYIKIYNDQIVEAAEKRPISRNAIAGFYYFKKGKDFVESALNIIRKEDSYEGNYFIAPSFNEMVLRNKKLINIQIDSSKYHNFYSPKLIEEYERKIK